MPSRQSLPTKLAVARQQLQKAQLRVAELEARLVEGLPTFTNPTSLDPTSTDPTSSDPTSINLRNNGERYQSILDTMVQGCQLIGFDWRYLYVNDAAARYSRRKKHELLGATLMECYPAIETTALFAVLQRSMLERSSERIEQAVTYPDGTSAWFDLLIQPVPEGISMLALDITERKQREEALRSSEMRFRSLVEAIEDYAIFLLDPHGSVTSWNTGAERLNGYQPAEMIGQPFSRFFTPEDQQRDRPQQLLHLAAVEGRTEDEGWRVRKDGSQFWANGVITALRNTDGSLSGFGKITRDLTQRKRAEENIRKLHRTLGVLSDINQAIVRIRHLPSLFTKACAIAVDKGEFRLAWIGLLDPATGRINPVTTAGLSARELENFVSTLNTPALIEPLRTGERLINNDLQNAPLWRSVAEEALQRGCRATVVLPLMVGGEFRGLFNLYASEIDFFDEQEMRLMDEMAGDIAFAIEVAEQEEQRQNAEAAVKRYAERIEILHQIDKGIINARSTEAILEAALQHLRRLIPCQRANVGLINRTKDEGVLFVVDDAGPTTLGAGLRVPILPDFFQGYDARNIKLVPDLRVLQATNPRFKQAVQEGLLSGINVLLMDHDQPIGTLGLFANTPDFFTAEHQEIISEVGSQLAIAIRQMQLSEQLAQYMATLEHKVAERTADLQAALGRVEAILNNSPDGILLVDADLMIQQTNAAFNTLFGPEWAEYLGQSLLTLLHPDAIHTNGALHQIEAAKQHANHLEVRAIRRNGTTFDVELTLGKIAGDGLVCMIRDISARKAQERQLRYHAAIQENVSDAVIATDMGLRIQSWNQAAVRIYGWTAAEAIGQVAPDLLQIRFHSVIEQEAGVKQFNEEGSLQQETIQRRKDGTDILVLGSVTRLEDEKGVPIGVIAINRDITERKAQERQLRYHASIQESVSDAVIATDMHFRIQSWNRTAELIYGWSAAEAIGRSVNELLETTYGSAAAGERILRDFFARSAWQGEVIQHHRDGRLIHVHASVNLFKDERGQPIGVVSVNRDITEQKHAEKTLQGKIEEERQFQAYLKALHEIIIELTGIDQLDTFYYRAVQLGCERLGFDRLAIFLYDARDETAVGTYGIDPQGKLVDASRIRFTLDPEGVMHHSADRAERFYFKATTTLYNNKKAIGQGWNAAAVLWNGTRNLGWLVADNHLRHAPASKPLLDILGLYALSVGTLLAQKQAQLALKASEALYRLLAENISDLIMRSTLTSECLYVSPSVQTLLGYTPEELTGQLTVELIHPADRPVIGAAYSAALERKDLILPHQYRARHKAGHYIWLETVGRPLFKEGTDKIVELITSSREITARKQVEDALRESEERFRLLLNAAPVATVISDRHGLINLVNVQAETLFGYSRAELTGQPVEILVPAYAHRTHVNNRLAYVAEPRVRPMGLGMELHARRKDGSEVPVEIELSYIETQDGIIVMSFILDITERKRITAQLEQQRSFLRNVIDVSPSMIFVKDYDGRFVLVNSAVANLYHTTTDALIGKTDADFNPSGQEVAAFLAADQQVITSGNLLFVEEPITNPNGKVHWLQTTKVRIVSEDGQSNYVLGVSNDITERKAAEEALRASEEKYRSLVETMRGGLAVLDPEFRVTFVNDRFCELLGYSRAEIIGKQHWSFVDPADLPLLKAQSERRRQAESTTYEIPMCHKDGHQIHVLLSGSPLLDQQGNYNGSIVVATDITIQKQAEATLRQALAKEKELGDLKTRFVSMASHEFRTPLATILAAVETLSIYRHKLSDLQIDQRLDKIKDHIGHLKNIMEDVLLLARMQARRVEFNPVKLDLHALTYSVLEEFQSQVDRVHRLEYTFSDETRELWLDRKLMRQIISNLISNALKYSPESTVVRLHLAYTEAEVILTVRDEGIGIPEADLPHLFEPFHRAANVGTISGTGLGLVITHEAVELHGGTIAVESQQGVGTTFRIQIPIGEK